MGNEPLTRKLAAILYADVAGYSRLTGEDEEATHRALSNSLDTITDSVEKHGGTIMHIAGDAVLADFPTVSDALICAASVQHELAERNKDLPENRRVQFRIGVNLGEVIVDRNEIYGDGVNIAARLESLADPGGICISESVHIAAGNKLPLGYEFIGEQEVKNIAKPVKAYRVRMKSGEVLPSARGVPKKGKQKRGHAAVIAAAALVAIVGALVWLKPAVFESDRVTSTPPTLALPEKPSIAVLPFTNMSGDPQQEYFTDGMTEDVITDLSKISDLFVIARNSTFTYKGKAVKVQQVAKDLGVRYVLEGSVQRAGEQVRINAQLIDATTGGHLWAERYDGSMVDVFALQDQVTRKIVAALALNLAAKEPGKREATKNPQAYDAFLQGWALYRRFSADDFAQAIPHFQDAVRLDPDYGRAYGAFASLYWESWRQGNAWTAKVNPTDNNASSFVGARYKVDKYLEFAMRNPSPLAYRVASATYWDYRKFDEAIAEAERAVTLDPNDPDGHVALAWALIFSGRPQEALPAVQRAMRLDPLHPEVYMYVLGVSRLGLDQFDEAVATLERAHEQSPENRELNLPLAVAFERLGRHQQAQAALKRYTDVWSIFATNVDGVMGWWPFKREADIRRFGGALVTAGLCCTELLEQYIERVRQGGTLQ
jgi:adenylate cyclase